MSQKENKSQEIKNTVKLPLIRRIFSDRQYHWMLCNLPFRIMYVNTWIDSQHKMWLPRWGWSEIQKQKAEAWANDMMEKLKLNEK